MFLKEACVETGYQAQVAEKNGAHRIELCGDLSVGGITPDYFVVQQIKEKIKIPIHVMIRPRSGDFVYTKEEFELMKLQIQQFKNLGVEGVVFGILKRNSTLDIDKIKALVKLAIPMKIVVHKAIDETPDIIVALKELLEIDGITAVLTSGGALTAEKGKKTLKEMVTIAKNKLNIIAAGSITYNNLLELHQYINSGYYHGKKIVLEA